MAKVRIKQLEERVATVGLHMGGGQERRKLEPGEVVDIPEDLTLPDGKNLFDILWNTGKLEATFDSVTRPLDYENAREAKLCSPTFKSTGLQEDEERDRMRAAVAERLVNSEAAPVQTVATPPETKSATARRSARRKTQKVENNGEEISP